MGFMQSFFVCFWEAIQVRKSGTFRAKLFGRGFLKYLITIKVLKTLQYVVRDMYMFKDFHIENSQNLNKSP